jgi:cytochrome c peroxidase
MVTKLSFVLFSLCVVGCVTDEGGELETTEQRLVSDGAEQADAAEASTHVDDEDEQLLTARRKHDALPNNLPFRNQLGHSATWSAEGSIELENEFFQELGTNDRQCGNCHQVSQGWTISAAKTRARFERTRGRDPLFRTNDGTNSPTADVSTLKARRAAYSMLLSRGTIRVGIGMPAGAEFELIAVDDPYGHASVAELSLFRRPLPAANLAFIRQVMWDGRVTGATIDAALAEQANGATMGHAAATTPLTADVRDAIVGFETALFNAQIELRGAGRLDSHGGRGGAEALAGQQLVVGRFDLFDGYANSKNAKRRSIFRGQELFNTKTRATGGTCLGCHSAQNVGTNVNGRMFDIGTSAGSRRAPDQPLYTLRNIGTQEIVTTTDPGRALITGKWADMNRFKTPSLRGLAARAPYFHGGSANTLDDVVDFYEEALGFSFTAQEQIDLVNFMSAL